MANQREIKSRTDGDFECIRESNLLLELNYFHFIPGKNNISDKMSGATMTAMTAFSIFMKKCRDEHAVMFPKEKLGKIFCKWKNDYFAIILLSIIYKISKVILLIMHVK